MPNIYNRTKSDTDQTMDPHPTPTQKNSEHYII